MTTLPPVTVIRKAEILVPTLDDAPKKLQVNKFMKEHHEKCNLGFSTGAYFGLQWANCGDYVNIQCTGCGDTLSYRTKNSEMEIIHSKDIQNGKRKISGVV